MITISLDTTKIDKGKIVEGKKGGKWLNLVLIETPNSDYGDFMVKQDSTKEEREAGVKTPILGNAKHLQKREPFSAKPPRQEPPATPDEDEIPF